MTTFAPIYPTTPSNINLSFSHQRALSGEVTNFAQLSDQNRRLIRSNCSRGAAEFLTELLSMPDNFSLWMKTIINITQERTTMCAKLLKELSQLGFARCNSLKKKDGTFNGKCWSVSNIPMCQEEAKAHQEYAPPKSPKPSKQAPVTETAKARNSVGLSFISKPASPEKNKTKQKTNIQTPTPEPKVSSREQKELFNSLREEYPSKKKPEEALKAFRRSTRDKTYTEATALLNKLLGNIAQRKKFDPKWLRGYPKNLVNFLHGDAWKEDYERADKIMPKNGAILERCQISTKDLSLQEELTDRSWASEPANPGRATLLDSFEIPY